jgi:hypothetical protein
MPLSLSHKIQEALTSVCVRSDGIISSPVDVLLFCHDVDRGVVLDSKAYATIADSIRDDLENRGFRCLTIAHPWSRLTGRKAWGDPISINRAYLRAHIKNAIAKATLRSTKNDAFVALYDNLLQSTEAKAVICIGSPPQLLRAAKRRKIKTIEALHGVGYTNIDSWAWDRRCPDELPSIILSYDAKSSQLFKEVTNNNSKVVEVSHPFLKRFIQPTYQSRLPMAWRGDSIPKKHGKRILVLLQWGYSGEFPGLLDSLPNGLYPEALLEAVQRTRHSVQWCLRLHPVQMTKKCYRHHKTMAQSLSDRFPNVEWKIWSERPLPTLLPSIDGCLTMSSMACYEAAAFGIPSLLLSPALGNRGPYSQMFEDLVSEGYAVKVTAESKCLIEWAEQSRPLLTPRVGNLLCNMQWENVIKLILN